jgi:hypothetical protein
MKVREEINSEGLMDEFFYGLNLVKPELRNRKKVALREGIWA